MVLHQYDYIFAIGTLFAMLDAYNNGASAYSEHNTCSFFQ
jgi:sodium-dependent phosphate transporter